MNLFREPSHFIVLIVLLALLFGWKKLPDMARSVGRSMRIFKSEVKEMKNDGKDEPAVAKTSTDPLDSRVDSRVVAEEHRPVTDPLDDGIVLDQDPGGDSQARPGSIVTIVVGRLV